MNYALLTAGGTGSRMGQDIPKQFMHIDNKPVIVHTLEAFENHPGIDGIIVVTLQAWKEVLSAYAKQFNITKLKWIVNGGATGHESIWNGLAELKKSCTDIDAVMVHDGNRPLVSADIISDSLAKYTEFGSAVACIPCTEVVFKSEDGISSTETVQREYLYRTQTPHTYRLFDLIGAHEEAKAKGIVDSAASCDLMLKLGRKTYFSRGSEENIKITTVDDINIVKALFSVQTDSWIK